MEACNLPNMDMISKRLHCFFIACPPPSPSSCTHPHWPPHHHQLHPYVTISIADTTIASTRVIPNSQDLKWNEHFKIPLAHCSPFIVFHVRDNDIFDTELIDTVSIPAALVASGKPPKPETTLLVSLQYRPIDRNPIYIHGIAGDPEKLSMRDTYFPVRKRGSVMLYQDTHVREGELHEIELEKRNEL